MGRQQPGADGPAAVAFVGGWHAKAHLDEAASLRAIISKQRIDLAAARETADTADAMAAAGEALSCDAAGEAGAACAGAASATDARRTPDELGCAASSGFAAASQETEPRYGAAQRAMTGRTVSP